MKILVLGSSAAGGFPQWNCSCHWCTTYRRGELSTMARTQSSVAVSQDGERWVLVNASPDIERQIARHPALQPRGGARPSPLEAVVVTDSHLHHVAGLLSLRSRAALEVYATPLVFEDLTSSLPLLQVLEHYGPVHWHMLPVFGDTPAAGFVIPGFPELRFTALALPARTPPHARQRSETVGECIALQIEDLRSGQRLFHSPSVLDVGERELEWMRRADCLLVDGCFWHEDEMREAGLAIHGASELGHLPLLSHGARRGMIDVLDETAARRKILTHVHNSNPILDERGEPRRTLAAHGIEVAHDGMVIEL